MDQMKIFHGSTPYLKQGYGSYHSRSTVMGGSAILDAAENFKNKLKGQAAERLGCPADKVSLGAGLTASFGGSSLALSDLGLSSLYAEGTFENHHHTYAFGAAAAHVTVDPGTGQVTLLEYVTIEDIGRIINPLTSTGQAIGAVVQGLGGTFLEAFQYDSDGQFLSGSLADYLLPTATDFPNIKAIVLENAPAPHNPLGAKGGGEGGIVPVGGVVANAVAEALTSLGIEPHDLPLTPQRIWGLIQEKKKRAA
jgi:carbon-monoxide dehydrogenase large subunit